MAPNPGTHLFRGNDDGPRCPDAEYRSGAASVGKDHLCLDCVVPIRLHLRHPEPGCDKTVLVTPRPQLARQPLREVLAEIDAVDSGVLERVSGHSQFLVLLGRLTFVDQRQLSDLRVQDLDVDRRSRDAPVEITKHRRLASSKLAAPIRDLVRMHAEPPGKPDQHPRSLMAAIMTFA